MKVLFITGAGRSGSTILSTLLGQLDGFLSVGEVAFLWFWGILEGQRCGCGAEIPECPLWKEAARPFLNAPRQEVQSLAAATLRLKSRPAVRRMLGGKRAQFEGDVQCYASALQSVYRGLREATGCSVLIDSSKDAPFGYAAALLPGTDLYVVHLVRDPRAFVHSWQRKKLKSPSDPSRGYMTRISPRHSIVGWNLKNALAEYFWGWRPKSGRYMRVRYEDFAQDPRKTILDIRDMLGEKSEAGFFVDARTARLHRVTHQVYGNPARFHSDEVRIVPDLEWTRSLSPRTRWLTTLTTSPFLKRYGYPLRVNVAAKRAGAAAAVSIATDPGGS